MDESNFIMKQQPHPSVASRLAIWQATHKQLIHDDTHYRRRFRNYLATVICFSCLLLPFYLPFFGIRLFGPAADISIILGLAAIVVYASLRQIHFQSKQISQYLRSNNHPTGQSADS
jgi:hypothetical protein